MGRGVPLAKGVPAGTKGRAPSLLTAASSYSYGETMTQFDRDLDAWAKARGLRPHTQELVGTMAPVPSGGYVLDEYAFAGEPVTCLTVPTPEPFNPADLGAKRRAQFPANRKGERAFLAAERKR